MNRYLVELTEAEIDLLKRLVMERQVKIVHTRPDDHESGRKLWIKLHARCELIQEKNDEAGKN